MAEILRKAHVLNPTNPNKSTKLFGGKASGILNWNDIAYPHFYKHREQIRALFWRASEVDMTQDVKQFPELPERTKNAFLKIIGLLATLDGPQTRIAHAISQYATDPSVQSIMATIADQESEHNHSYAYVLSSVVSLAEQNESFETGRKDLVLLKRNQRIMDVYNTFVEKPTIENVLKTIVYTALLEGLFFYSGFAFFYNLARQQLMVGTSTMISYINREELQHGRFISELFRATLAENPHLNTEGFADWVYEQFRVSVELESEWSRYILAGIDGIDLVEMEGYVKYRANKMLRLMGLSEIYPEHTKNTMPWIEAYVDNFDGNKTDFFEQKSRQYTKTSDLNGFDEL
ncbi:ribonucleotide-diphosphate reductase subunit beta [Bacillus chungangensis]|uniref:Ribonucleoside-diphosphate reductase subunit beta n=1 Tax=Bacillus chungangensis TaxID=587633 RepID=A0ABT9WMG0_9BACI|nr:ribonucleotide-diphosphate reductase subunit beta [Bacillus chungangensis]MDQ0174417.1 ribonucleoside-diphosphate reductase beta chain [Bacillus chungangensis]